MNYNYNNMLLLNVIFAQINNNLVIYLLKESLTSVIRNQILTIFFFIEIKTKILSMLTSYTHFI